MPIKNVILKPVPVKPVIPEEGFYVTLQYMYCDADGYASHTAGPFPMEKRHLLIELLNVLDQMVKLYADTGKGGDEGYESVPLYNAWFDENYKGPEDDDTEFRESIGLEIEYVPDGYGSIAKLTDFEVYYHDGQTLDRFEVDLI